MKMKKALHLLIFLLLADFTSQAENVDVTPGPFLATMDSLTNYTCPEWFRDAKFGIWAHWGPQAVPMRGDWYARKMYQQGSPDYLDHLARFGHPSTNGYKDIIPLWKAEKWDPDRLMTLYKKAGAKYFVSMGTHHDDFFLWNSQLHKWNSVNYGPHKDVVAIWQAAAQKNGLRFGVSEHLGASFTWFQDSHRADTNGPFAGVPYDGANPQYQDLYHFPAQPGDTGWYSNDPRWQKQWLAEIEELERNYHPDLLYSDGGVPFGNEIGLSMIADYYNTGAAFRQGRVETVYNCKQNSGGRWVEDVERGVMSGINPYPWQTDTSIGDWFYNENWKYRPVTWTIDMLVDIVSKNGNLLLNIVLRPDGSLDPEAEQTLADLADWSSVNGEAIYGTRPWLVYGEGPVQAKGGHFKEDFNYTAQDIRFTTKGNALYAIALGWPTDGKLLIKSLAQTNDSINQIQDIQLLGASGDLTFTQSSQGLTVSLPAEHPSKYTVALKINGTHLKPIEFDTVNETDAILPSTQGDFTLPAALAELKGDQIQLETRSDQPNIGFWDKATEHPAWTAKIQKPGHYLVILSTAAANSGTEVTFTAGNATLTGIVPGTDSWDNFQSCVLGKIEIKQTGALSMSLRPPLADFWQALNLRWIKLISID
jgi:alpha-L-fucosidase